MAAGAKVKGVRSRPTSTPRRSYPIATLTKQQAQVRQPQAFVDYVLSPAGQQVLTAAGFQKP